MGDEHLTRAIELCLAVYRVTERFPAAETLRFHLRELSLDIIKFLVYSGAYSIHSDGKNFDLDGFRKKLRELLIYCEIAKEQRWMDPRNFDVLSRMYKDFFGDVEQWLNKSDAGSETPRTVNTEGRGPKTADLSPAVAGLSPRKLQILKFLRLSDSGASMADFAKVIKGKSRKTVERDLKHLIGANLVFKKGRTKGARFYPAA
ncbi:MAG: hypothetical protein HYS15_02520 [Candidatus Spechtbacteria bacterium]|nr:hypothetical protein [Candidatus Spechtbacteria bacterium]